MIGIIYGCWVLLLITGAEKRLFRTAMACKFRGVLFTFVLVSIIGVLLCGGTTAMTLERSGGVVLVNVCRRGLM